MPAADSAAPTNKRVNRIKVRITLFFDGTLNNRRNSGLREQSPRTYRRVSGGDDSYENDPSNVARLEAEVEDSAAGYDHYIRVYTEGIGTTDLGRDSKTGYGLGIGATGIESKVIRGLATALGLLARLPYPPSATIIERLTIDTCGFSRGAAAARHCVHRVLDDEYDPESGVLIYPRLQTRIEEQGWKVGQLHVLAVGLFDTVSSHGVVYWNDVVELGLDAIRQAGAVLQLAAAEEYRGNFSLTNIDSAGGRGRQVYLPGAHSDIGGGYLDGAGERRVLTRGGGSQDVKAFMLQRGWYEDRPGLKELEYVAEQHSGPDGSVYVNEYVEGHRASIARAYTFIPLRVMADFFKEHGVPVRARLYDRYDPGAVPGRARIEAYAKRGGTSKPTDWEGVDPVLGALRHGYLHVSFSDEFGLGVRVVNTGSFFNPSYRPTRYVYTG